MDLQEIKKECSKIERNLIALEAERDTLLALLEEQEKKLVDLETQKEHNKKGQIFLRLKAADTRIAALASIEEIVTAALQEMYGEDYKFSLELKEVSSKEGENTGLFTILPCVEKLHDGKTRTSHQNGWPNLPHRSASSKCPNQPKGHQQGEERQLADNHH